MRILETASPSPLLHTTWVALEALRIPVNEAVPGRAPREVQLWRGSELLAAQRLPVSYAARESVLAIDIGERTLPDARRDSSTFWNDYRELITGHLRERRELRSQFALRSRVLAHERVA